MIPKNGFYSELVHIIEFVRENSVKYFRTKRASQEWIKIQPLYRLYLVRKYSLSNLGFILNELRSDS